MERQRRWYAREWREKRGISQEELAERIGTSKGYVSDLESGKRRYNRDHVEAIVSALGLSSLAELFTDPGEDDLEAKLRAEFRAASGPQRERILAVVRAMTGTDN